MKTLEELIKELPLDLQQEVKDFAQFLLEKQSRPKQNKLRMDWAGALREYRDQYHRSGASEKGSRLVSS